MNSIHANELVQKTAAVCVRSQECIRQSTRLANQSLAILAYRSSAPINWPTNRADVGRVWATFPPRLR